MMDTRIRIVIATLLVVVFALAAIIIRMSTPSEVPSSDSARTVVETQAVQTFISHLTASAPAASATVRAVPTPTRLTPTVASGTPGCVGLRFVRDVTIPDNTEMNPAQVFTKTWQVENTGTCAWKPGFQVVLIGGVAMGGSPYKVTQTVGPAGSIQVSIKMVAPTNQTGVIQGTWKMTDENGAPFGDYLSVVIVVKGRSPATRTPTPSPSP